jgi:hypothetical protein
VVRGEGALPVADADGVVTFRVDATDAEAWVHLDLIGGAVVGADGGWTLAVQRSNLKLNGGVSGSAGVEAAWVDVGGVLAVERPPADGWTTDAADTNGDGVPEYALAAWYDYDPVAHTLSAADGVCVLAGPAGAVAVQLLGYYDAAGTSGFVSLAYRVLPGFDGSVPGEVLTIDASAPVYVDLGGAAVVAAPADPATDLGWDLTADGYTLRLNGGVSGSGAGEAVTLADGVGWDDLGALPTEGWATDAAPPSPYEDGTALAAWFNYDPVSHQLSPSGRLHVVRGAEGDVYVVQVEAWDAGVFSLRVAPWEAL